MGLKVFEFKVSDFIVSAFRVHGLWMLEGHIPTRGSEFRFFGVRAISMGLGFSFSRELIHLYNPINPYRPLKPI